MIPTESGRERVGGTVEFAGQCLGTRDHEQRIARGGDVGHDRSVVHCRRVRVDRNGQGVRLAGCGGDHEGAVAGSQIHDHLIVLAAREERIGLPDVDVDDHSSLEHLHRQRIRSGAALTRSDSCRTVAVREVSGDQGGSNVPNAARASTPRDARSGVWSRRPRAIAIVSTPVGAAEPPQPKPVLGKPPAGARDGIEGRARAGQLRPGAQAHELRHRRRRPVLREPVAGRARTTVARRRRASRPRR